MPFLNLVEALTRWWFQDGREVGRVFVVLDGELAITADAVQPSESTLSGEEKPIVGSEALIPAAAAHISSAVYNSLRAQRWHLTSR